MAKKQEMTDLYLGLFCGNPHLPLFVRLENYLVPCRWHRHCDFAELALVLNGTAVSCVPGFEVQLKVGDILLLGKGTLHNMNRLRELRNYNVLFDPRLLDFPCTSARRKVRYRNLKNRRNNLSSFAIRRAGG